MKIQKIKNYTTIIPDENSIEEFYLNFKNQYSEIAENHLILNFLSFKSIIRENITSFIEISKKHKKNNSSFIIVNDVLDIDAFPEDFNIVPTLLEAEDVLEMENIERELGF